ncbi:MAG TPA: alpha/beta hydrolase [Steroidobacteraceae bacterium]|nr:alpha/beta hydrolase [Steroidobacteraceae bacterium]
MSPLTQRQIRADGVTLAVTEAGSGPPVIFCHGFPGLGYSFRHQLPPVAAAGWRAIAPDQRGYGGSSRPTDPALYDANYVMQDMIAILDAIGERRAVFVGHDFGAQQVCNLAVRHPERVAAVVIMSCPYDFDLAGRGGAGARPTPTGGDPGGAFAVPGVRPSAAFAAVARQHFFHMHYFQSIGPAETELGARPREFLLRLMHALSAEGRLLDWSKYPSEGTGYLDVLAPAPPLPWRWLSEAEFAHYEREYTRDRPATTFMGGLNSYRMADRNWELGERYADADILQPALFIAGAQDVVLKMIPADALEVMRRRTPDLREVVLVPGAGHFVQQEQPQAVNAALLRFLRSL